ncbi:kinase-like domain-containing protein [Xylaria digitata]|nr:kinase-like domain-containing protein [Xylaria digitata]
MVLQDVKGRGFSRGGFRGGMVSARGGLNDNIPSRHGHWSASTSSNRGGLSSPSNAIPIYSGTPDVKDEDEEAQNASKPPQDNEAEETLKDEKAVADQTPSPRPPTTAPTGPANSKFSFAFKTSNKNPVAAPKPEISQKFSAAPKKETQSIIDDRDRDLPKDTPREPASARARADRDYHHSRAQPPEQPRTRKVIITRRKLKPKPPLEPELARSTSVYFRKPGNESVVGSGTYGKVFKGKHVYTKKLVALKRIRMEGERDGFPVTAMREVKLLQSLRHDNIVDLHEVMIEKNECYMVFEYLSHDLTGLLNHPTYKLDAAQKKHLAMQLFKGLDYLHTRGVLHRDIKAANILVSSDGILKLADFGLARFYAKRHQLDYTNRVITIWYRSPELLLGETRYGAAVDIWSAACVMVEIFTRHAIFPGDGGEISQLEKVYNILGTPNRKEWPGLADTPWFELLRPSYRKPNVFAEKYRERVPAAAFDLLEEMFQYDPVKRPSAADVLKHPYFTIEQPPPRQAVELKDIKGDWHEFESKALRREKEKQEKQQREARRAAAAAKDGGQDKERKRPPSVPETQPESKRPHLEGQASNLSRELSSTALPPATGTTVE